LLLLSTIRPFVYLVVLHTAQSAFLPASMAAEASDDERAAEDSDDDGDGEREKEVAEMRPDIAQMPLNIALSSGAAAGSGHARHGGLVRSGCPTACWTSRPTRGSTGSLQATRSHCRGTRAPSQVCVCVRARVSRRARCV
jgi:hypothetical protein